MSPDESCVHVYPSDTEHQLFDSERGEHSVKGAAGILADLLNTISRGGFVVKEASAKMIGNDAVECFFVIVPQKLENIVKLIKRIEKVPGFRKARFE